MKLAHRLQAALRLHTKHVPPSCNSMPPHVVRVPEQTPPRAAGAAAAAFPSAAAVPPRRAAPAPPRRRPPSPPRRQVPTPPAAPRRRSRRAQAARAPMPSRSPRRRRRAPAPGAAPSTAAGGCRTCGADKGTSEDPRTECTFALAFAPATDWGQRRRRQDGADAREHATVYGRVEAGSHERSLKSFDSFGGPHRERRGMAANGGPSGCSAASSSIGSGATAKAGGLSASASGWAFACFWRLRLQHVRNPGQLGMCNHALM